jgi:transcriptional regulator with XRE-family HTH domain
MPQHVLARRVSLDPSLISMLENGKRKPSLDTLERISEALDIPFHLFTLLATEKEDFKAGDAKSFEQLAIGLTKLLLKSEKSETAVYGSVNRTAGYIERKSSRRTSRNAGRKTN